MKPLMNSFTKKTFNLILLGLVLTGSIVSCQDAKPKENNSLQANASQTSAQVEKPNMDLATAVFQGNLEAVNQHIKAGSDLNTKDPMSGSTPLITATTFNRIDIANALIDAGADLTIKNSDGATALHVAAFFCRVEIVQKLIDANVDKSARNNYGATARESVMGSFSDVKPIYEFMQTQLGPFGLKLDLQEIEKTRPVIAMMLQ